MELGLSLPTYAPIASPDAIVRVAERAEAIGLASLWTYERLLRPRAPVSFNADTPAAVLPDFYAVCYEPLETLAYVASRTSRIRLATSVIDALFQSPVMLARRLATLDQLCGGRLTVGLGQGWVAPEFVAAGVSPRRRGAGFREHIEAMRAVWGPDPVRFEGRFYRIPESDIGPKPMQPDGPPLLVGAVAPAAIERTAAMGLGLNPVFMTWEMLEGTVEAFRSAARAAGHDPASLPVVVRVNGRVTDGPAGTGERPPLTGPVDRVADDLARLADLGVDHVLWAMDTEPDRQLEVMERLVGAAP